MGHLARGTFSSSSYLNKDYSMSFQLQDGVEGTKRGFSQLLYGNILVLNQVDNKAPAIHENPIHVQHSL